MGDGISIQTTLNQAAKVARAQQGQQTTTSEDEFARKIAQEKEANVQAVKEAQKAEEARLKAKQREQRKKRRRKKRKKDRRSSQEPGHKVDIKV